MGWVAGLEAGWWVDRLGLRGWVEMLRCAQDDRRGVGGPVEARKKQIPRCARNDNSRAFRRAERRVEVGVIRLAGSMENRRRVAEEAYRSEDRPLHVVRVEARAGSGSCSCR